MADLDSSSTLRYARSTGSRRPTAALINRFTPSRTLIALAIITALGVLFIGYEALWTGTTVSTDNAYVGAEIAQVTALTPGIISEIPVSETQFVHSGDLLVRLDSSDANIELDSANADLRDAIANQRAVEAQVRGFSAKVRESNAEIGRAAASKSIASAQAAQATAHLDRRRKLLPRGFVSLEDLSSADAVAKSAVGQVEAAAAAEASAMAGRDSANADLAAAKALLSNSGSGPSPKVEAAISRQRRAELALKRTVIRAPVNGVIDHRTAQLGQRVSAGDVLMMVVPIQDAFVDANFKEGQLARIRPGQRATVTSDYYGPKIVYHGLVAGLAGGTGAAFAQIPVENATGNWIKIVQRVPVRIRLAKAELLRHPLVVGLSMKVTIDVGD